MKKQLGVDTVPIEAASELFLISIAANQTNVEIPFPVLSGRRQRHVIGIHTFTTRNFALAVPPSLGPLATTVSGPRLRFTLRDPDGEFQIQDAPYMTFNSTGAPPAIGERVKVFRRLPVDFDKSFLQTTGTAAVTAAVMFLYGPEAHGELR